MRDSMVLYWSFSEVLNSLPDKDAGKLYKAITQYAMRGEEPDLDGILKSYFALIKPQIDANNKRYADGKRGGRPQKNKPVVLEDDKPMVLENEKPVVLKKKSEKKPNENENENENENVNVNVNVEEEEKEGNPPPPLPPVITLPCLDGEYEVTQGEYEEMRDLYPGLDVMQELRAMKGWFNGNKPRKKMKSNIPKFMYSWLNDESRKDRAAPRAEPEMKDNRLGTFGDYKQTSTDDEWEDLQNLAMKDINGRTT